MEVGAVEVHPVAAPQFAHQVDGFPQSRETLLEFRPFARKAGSDLVQRLAGAHPETRAGVQTRHRGECLRDNGRVVPECRGSTEVPSWMRRVRSPTAAIQARENGACPPLCRQAGSDR